MTVGQLATRRAELKTGGTIVKPALAIAAAAALVCISTSPASAQPAGQGIVAIYHVAPGHQVDFLKWLDQQDRIAAAAGVARGQLYAHMDGDSWDYLVINPVTTPAQDAALEAAGKRMGVNVGRGGIELRKHITSHTDTIVRGPMSAAEYLAFIGEK
jgi:membrane-bound lytic murein transglycosylase B